MIYLKKFNEEIQFIDKINLSIKCKKYGIKKYTINSDGSIDVNEYVDLCNKGLTKLLLKFNKVNGWFDCSENELTSLEGSPVEVNSNFYCYNNKLESLEGSPKKVNSNFDCSYNNLISLKGSPKEVNGYFKCHTNELTSFEFSPKIIRGDFNCEYNNIKTFEYFPSFVKYGFYCSDNLIEVVWKLFEDCSKIELLNDFDIFRDEDTDEPAIVMDRLNDFLLTIGKDPVKKVYLYKNI